MFLKKKLIKTEFVLLKVSHTKKILDSNKLTAFGFQFLKISRNSKDSSNPKLGKDLLDTC